ncbi:MAG TPA: gliding motility-associated C-terminal domain-containing protein, partial [Brumimicrobium sp.]|nr:gliding motility-associated C-terminal domain-containing protein [Brumimicrobium sp.]
ANFTFEPTHIFSDDPHVNFQNNSEMNNENEWTFGAFGESTEVHPSFDFPIGKEANYGVKLIVTSEKGCVDSIIKLVSVRDQTLFYVPNTFTPNDDEFNTVFLPIMTVGIDKYNYNMKVYNRWGECIFETYDPEVGWDGTYNGKVAQDGTYFWKIQFTEYDSSNVVYVNGFVNLIR